MARPLVSIIIVNWNGFEFLDGCLSLIRSNDYRNYEVILVDNGSTDGSVKFVREKFSEIKLIEAKKNLGFAGGNNIGYGAAKGDYILFLNNDTVAENNFLSILVDYLEENPSVGACQPKLVKFDGITMDSAGSYFTSTGILYHYGFLKPAASPLYGKPRKIFSAKGAAMLFRRKVLEKVGVFDRDFFNYFEETDLCWRTWLAGYEVVYVPSSVVYHKAGGTALKVDQKFVIFIGYYSFRNRICTLIKNLGWWEFLKIFPFHVFCCLIVALGFLAKGQPAYTKGILKAIGWNIANLSSTLKKRKIVQKEIRKVRDRDFFPIIKKNPKLIYYYLFFRLKGFENYIDEEIN
jgi:GT2 family glycosyltransferase